MDFLLLFYSIVFYVIISFNESVSQSSVNSFVSQSNDNRQRTTPVSGSVSAHMNCYLYLRRITLTEGEGAGDAIKSIDHDAEHRGGETFAKILY